MPAYPKNDQSSDNHLARKIGSDDWDFPDPKVVEEQLKQEFPEQEREKVWKEAAETVKTYHDELINRWQASMDSLLVYAGLFSAVLTAFNVQSYQLLQSAPTDPMLVMLEQISAQLNSFSINPSFVNSTQPARSLGQIQAPFRASVSSVWINTLWFTSLVCSLASASIALVVKQWLHEVSSGLSGTSRETARIRQYRLNSLIKWKVGVIVLAPSLLLQAALALFLSGLLVLLWTIHETVAAITSALVGALFLFFIIVTVLPVFRLDCCYRSPQALGVFVLARFFWNGSIRLVSRASWRVYRTIPGYRSSFLSGVKSLFCKCYQLGNKMPRIPTWHGAEQTEVAQDSGSLDRHIATMAYTTTFAAQHLETLHIILLDLPCDQLFSCFLDIHQAWSRLWGPDEVDIRSMKPRGMLLSWPLLYSLRKMLTVDHNRREQLGGSWERLLKNFISRAYWHLPCSEECLSTLALLARGDSALAKHACSIMRWRFDQGGYLPFRITYGTIRNVTAMGKYKIEHPDDADSSYLMARTTEFVIRCVWHSMINNNGLTSQQEERVYDETRSFLSSVMVKVAMGEWSDTFVVAYVLPPLLELCRSISVGYRMVPGGFLDAVQQNEPTSSANDVLIALKSTIRDQRHQKGQLKPCFHTQQPPITPF